MMQTREKARLATITLGVIMAMQSSAQLNADTGNGMIAIESSHDVTTTIDRLHSILDEKGMTIFKRVDHTAGANRVGIELRPTELLIFGNPKVGTPLMHCSQTIALDLPQKALAYQDDQGKVWLVYNDPVYLAGRHGISNCDKPLQKVSKALGNFARFATMAQSK